MGLTYPKQTPLCLFDECSRPVMVSLLSQEHAMTLLPLALLLFSPAQADDWDIDIDGIDIGGGDSKGQEMVTYQGNSVQKAPDFVEGTLASIAHSGGTVTINCVDRDGISARIDYTLEGTNRDALKRFGDGIGLRVWGSSRGGGVQTRMPSSSSSIKSKNIPLVVSLPRNAKVKVSGGSGFIQVQGCEGAVAAANRSGDIVISGKLATVSATAPSGDVNIDVDESASMTGSSKISASGNARVRIPSDFGGRLTAKGSEVEVRQLVDGTQTSTLVQGSLGEGTASLSVSAKGTVKVETAN